MARTATSALADRIRIEDEVWDEAFSARLRSHTSSSIRIRSAASGPAVRGIDNLLFLVLTGLADGLASKE